jgi:hypothetical protein
MQALSLVRGNKSLGPHLLFALVLMAQLQIWDGVITQVLVGNGIARELNPFVVNSVNQGSFIVIKIAGLILCGMTLWLIGKRFPALATTAASIIAVFYAGIVAWNFVTVFIA